MTSLSSTPTNQTSSSVAFSSTPPILPTLLRVTDQELCSPTQHGRVFASDPHSYLADLAAIGEGSQEEGQRLATQAGLMIKLWEAPPELHRSPESLTPSKLFAAVISTGLLQQINSFCNTTVDVAEYHDYTSHLLSAMVPSITPQIHRELVEEVISLP